MTNLLRLGLVLAAALALSARALAQADVVEYYHLDALGNVMAVSNAAGTEIESHDYLPFGEEWCGTSVCGTVKAGQPKRFTGKERDAETGLDYFGARYYRANVGRFTTIDPVYTWQENLVDPQGWNRYAYVRNNPLKYVDPDGRVLVPALLVAWGAVEIGLQIYDSYSTIQTLTDPNASFRDKAISGGGFVLGAIAPGGGYGAAGKAAAGKADDLAEKLVKQGRYEFPDQTVGGIPYVGQSVNIPKRLGKHERDGRLVPGSEATTEVLGGKTAREIAEHRLIQELTGGVPASKSGQVANKVDPIGPNRRSLLDEKK